MARYDNCAISLPPAEIRANARLIAAAPELLEALRLTVQALQQLRSDPRIDINALITDPPLSIAASAIAKATGESA